MSKKIINIISGESDKNTLTLSINRNNEDDSNIITITQENFSEYLGMTYDEYLNVRQEINNFRVKLHMALEGTFVSIDAFATMLYKYESGEAITDYYHSTLTAAGKFTLSIVSNNDKTFKECTVEISTE